MEALLHPPPPHWLPPPVRRPPVALGGLALDECPPDGLQRAGWAGWSVAMVVVASTSLQASSQPHPMALATSTSTSTSMLLLMLVLVLLPLSLPLLCCSVVCSLLPPVRFTPILLSRRLALSKPFPPFPIPIPLNPQTACHSLFPPTSEASSPPPIPPASRRNSRRLSVNLAKYLRFYPPAG